MRSAWFGVVASFVFACSSESLIGVPDGADSADDAGSPPPAEQPDGGPPSVEAGTEAGPGLDGRAPFVTAPHLAWPEIPNHGGHVLDPLRVVTVIAADEPLATDLQTFGDAIPTSAWFASFAKDFGLTGTPTHVLVRGAHVDAGTSFTQAAMNSYIAATVAAATPSPAPDGHTVYVLYLPPGTSMVVNGAPDTACAGIPYHTGYGPLGDGMAVLNRCPGTFPSQIAMFTAVAAHEIAEAATDSNPTKNPAWEMWSDDLAAPWKSSIWNEVEMESAAENGDLCIFTRVVEKGFPFQRIFSNAAARAGGDPCVPALAVPYFNVSPDPKTGGWFAVTAGTDLDVPLVGWSTAETGDWLVWADKGKGMKGGTFATKLTAPQTRTVAGYAYPITNNAGALNLHVTIPSGVASGWWGAVELWSWHAAASGAYVPGEDFGHEAVVGFYVP